MGWGATGLICSERTLRLRPRFRPSPYQPPPTRCPLNGDVLHCLWENKAVLGAACKVSAFFDGIQDRFANLVFQACSVDVETLKCDATDVFSCLEANKDVLVASCSTYLTAMDKCYSDVKVFRNTIFATTECKVQTARS